MSIRAANNACVPFNGVTKPERPPPCPCTLYLVYLNPKESSLMYVVGVIAEYNPFHQGHATSSGPSASAFMTM